MKAAIDDDSSGLAETAAVHADVEKALRDDNKHDIRRAFEDVLDTAHTSRSSQAWSDPEPTRAEQDEERRHELEVRAAVSAKATEALGSQGIFVVAVLDDGTGGGWIFCCRDRVGRPYEARLDFAEQNALTDSSGPVGLVDRLAGAVVRSVLAERERWFRRMGAH